MHDNDVVGIAFFLRSDGCYGDGMDWYPNLETDSCPAGICKLLSLLYRSCLASSRGLVELLKFIGVDEYTLSHVLRQSRFLRCWHMPEHANCSCVLCRKYCTKFCTQSLEVSHHDCVTHTWARPYIPCLLRAPHAPCHHGDRNTIQI